MLTQPDTIGPYGSADRVWSDTMWPLYLVLLFAVEFHGGVGLYRVALKWGWFETGDPLATLAAYMKIGIEHAPYYGQPYEPATVAAEVTP